MKSRKHLLALICLVSACSALPSLAMADVNVVIGVAPPIHHYSTHAYIAAPGYWQWQSHRRVWVPERRHYHGGYFEREANRWQGSRHFDARSHWGHRTWGGHDSHDNRGQSQHGHGHGR